MAKAWHILLLSCVAATAEASDWYVSTTGPSDGDGSQAKPFATFDKLAALKAGDTVNVAEGTYQVSTALPLKPRTKWLGGFSADFKTRDPLATPALLRTTGGTSFLQLTSNNDDVTFDGWVFDTHEAAFTGGCAGCMPEAIGKPYVSLQEAGRATFKNVAFINAPFGAIDGSLASTLSFDNVVWLNVRPAAFNVKANCGYAAPLCADISVKNALALWTWRKSAASETGGGDAFVVGAGLRASFVDSIVAYSDGAAIALTGTPRSVELKRLIVFDNVRGDVAFADRTVRINEVKVGSGIDEASEPGRMERLALPWDATYLDRYLKRTAATFYGTRIEPKRAWMLSPLKTTGPQTPHASKWTYDVAVAGGLAPAPVVMAQPEPVAEKVPEPKKGKKLPGKGKKGKRRQ